MPSTDAMTCPTGTLFSGFPSHAARLSAVAIVNTTHKLLFIAPIPANWVRTIRQTAESSANRSDIGKSGGFTKWRSEEHTSELQSLMRISYAVFCLKKKTQYDQKKS